MTEKFKKAFRIGITFGVVNFFIILIGLTVTASDIIGDIINAPSITRTGNTTGLVIFFSLLGLWCGSMASQMSRDKWKTAGSPKVALNDLHIIIFCNKLHIVWTRNLERLANFCSNHFNAAHCFQICTLRWQNHCSITGMHTGIFHMLRDGIADHFA